MDTPLRRHLSPGGVCTCLASQGASWPPHRTLLPAPPLPLLQHPHRRISHTSTFAAATVTPAPSPACSTLPWPHHYAHRHCGHASAVAVLPAPSLPPTAAPAPGCRALQLCQHPRCHRPSLVVAGARGMFVKFFFFFFVHIIPTSSQVL